MRLVQFPRQPTSSRRSAIGALVFLFVGGVASPGCKKTLEVVCRSELPQFERRVSDAIVALEASGTNDSLARHPAALPPSPSRLAEVDRRDWKLWAEKGLDQAQGAIDIVGAQPGLVESRERLTAVANGLVAFHGLSAQGDSLKMIRTLRQIQEDVGKAERVGCAGSGR